MNWFCSINWQVVSAHVWRDANLNGRSNLMVACVPFHRACHPKRRQSSRIWPRTTRSVMNKRWNHMSPQKGPRARRRRRTPMHPRGHRKSLAFVSVCTRRQDIWHDKLLPHTNPSVSLQLGFLCVLLGSPTQDQRRQPWHIHWWHR